MKTNFTSKNLAFFALTFFLVCLSVNLSAQTSTKVTVANYSYTPKNITITVGDTVIWKETQGTHNVDGKTSVFPSNAVSFGNSLGSGWTYKFVFNTAGTYNYQCDPHVGLGMVGSITVNPKSATSIESLADLSGNIQLYPNPTTNYINLKVPASYSAIRSMKIYSLTGSLVDQKILSGSTDGLRYEASHLKNGIYFMEINAETRKEVIKFLKQ